MPRLHFARRLHDARRQGQAGQTAKTTRKSSPISSRASKKEPRRPA